MAEFDERWWRGSGMLSMKDLGASVPDPTPLEEARARAVRFVIHPYACPTNRDLASPCSCGRIANIDTLIAQAKAEAVEPHITPSPAALGNHDYCVRCAAEARHALSATEAPEAPAGER